MDRERGLRRWHHPRQRRFLHSLLVGERVTLPGQVPRPGRPTEIKIGSEAGVFLERFMCDPRPREVHSVVEEKLRAHMLSE